MINSQNRSTQYASDHLSGYSSGRALLWLTWGVAIANSLHYSSWLVAAGMLLWTRLSIRTILNVRNDCLKKKPEQENSCNNACRKIWKCILSLKKAYQKWVQSNKKDLGGKYGGVVALAVGNGSSKRTIKLINKQKSMERATRYTILSKQTRLIWWRVDFDFSFLK